MSLVHHGVHKSDSESNLVISEKKVLVANLALQINQPSLPELIQQFLYDQQYPDCPLTSANMSLHACPPFAGMISISALAAASYYTPSDPSGVCGIRREHIQATPSWRQDPARYDCTFVNSNLELDCDSCYNFRQLRQSSTVIVSKVQHQMSLQWLKKLPQCLHVMERHIHYSMIT